jgi:hypothetical protein
VTGYAGRNQHVHLHFHVKTVKILISYRHAGSASIVGRIYDHLASTYGVSSVFMDIDAIPYGTDFREVIREFLRSADVVLVVIGPLWRGKHDNGTVRIADEDDPVRVEIETALSNNIPVVPMLVGGAAMPTSAELPESISKLSFINAAPVDIGRDFNVHMARVIDRIDRILADRGKPQNLRLLQGIRVKLSRPQMALVTLSVAVCLVLPFGGVWAQISPPWPRGIPFITVAVEAATALFAFEVLRSSRVKIIHRVWLVTSLALGIILSSYLVLVSYFTYVTPSTNQLWAKGFVCTAEALLVYKSKCPDLGNDELKDAEYEAERLWTPGSVTTVKAALVISWLLGFAAIGVLAGSFIAQLRSRAMQQVAFAQRHLLSGR